MPCSPARGVPAGPPPRFCRNCDDEIRRCLAYHPEYGFTCLILGEHAPPHFDDAGGHWDEGGQWPLQLAEIAAERVRQDAKFGRLRDYADGTGGPGAVEAANLLRSICKANPLDGDQWSDILAEEVGEAFAETDPDALRRELVQVAAVAVAWLEALDRRRGES